jgi:hypothetical protein
MNLRRTRSNILKLLIICAASGLAIISIGTAVSDSSRSAASSSGPPATFTGAPLEANCTACHSSFTVNSGSGSVSIAGVPRNYLPGQQIPITVTVNDSTGVRFGFQMTGVDNEGRKAGNFVLPSPSPSPALPAVQLVNGFVNGNERQYIEHTNQGITPTTLGTKSWQFTWTAPARRVGKIGFYLAGNAANGDSSSDGDQIYTSSRSSLSGSAIASFDGDDRSDFSLFRPSDGVWYSLDSSQSSARAVKWGLDGDIPTPGDYDGDGITDRAVFRPSEGVWYILFSAGGYTGVRWGLAGDVPVAGDYDGDGKTDAAIFRPAEGTWYILRSGGGLTVLKWGMGGDIAVHGDYDGDAKTDIAVYRPSDGIWYILRSADGVAYSRFGLPTDLPVQADYDGDGRHDVAIFRPSSGEWWILRSSDGLGGARFGLSGDIPAPGDHDGDGLADLTVYRPSEGFWYSLKSSDLGVTGSDWGLPGDIPVASAYLDR